MDGIIKVVFTITRRTEKNRPTDVLQEEAQTGLDLCAFIGTSNLFFNGLVILNLSTLPKIVELSVVYLTISAISFVLAAVIYANIAGTENSNPIKNTMIEIGNWLSEYLGIYLFLISIPLLILGVTDSLLVQITTMLACYTGLLLYSMSPFSLDERRFGAGWDRILNTILLVLFTFGIYVVGIFYPEYLLESGVVFLVFLAFFSLFSFRLNTK